MDENAGTEDADAGNDRLRNSSVIVVYNSDHINHKTNLSSPENPQRLTSILNFVKHESNLYRLAMGNRQPDSDCPEGYLEAGFRNAGSGCAQATGNPAPGNRNSGAGKRNPISAEPEERNVRRKLRDTPPYPPTGGDFDHGQDDFSSSQRTSPGGQSTSTPLVQPRDVVAVEAAASKEVTPPDRSGKQSRGPFPRLGTDPPIGVQAPERRTNSRRGKRNGADQRLAEKDYTVGATRDEDLPDWASGWRDREHVPE